MPLSLPTCRRMTVRGCRYSHAASQSSVGVISCVILFTHQEKSHTLRVLLHLHISQGKRSTIRLEYRQSLTLRLSKTDVLPSAPPVTKRFSSAAFQSARTNHLVKIRREFQIGEALFRVLSWDMLMGRSCSELLEYWMTKHNADPGRRSVTEARNAHRRSEGPHRTTLTL